MVILPHAGPVLAVQPIVILGHLCPSSHTLQIISECFWALEAIDLASLGLLDSVPISICKTCATAHLKLVKQAHQPDQPATSIIIINLIVTWEATNS